MYNLLKKEVRIVPMNYRDIRNELTHCNNSKDVQEKYFLDELPVKSEYKYYTRKRLNSAQGSRILFQCDNRIITSATFQRNIPSDDKKYEACYLLEACSIEVFNPIDKEIMRRIWKNFKRFGNVIQRLSFEEYPLFENELHNVRKPCNVSR